MIRPNRLIPLLSALHDLEAEVGSLTDSDLSKISTLIEAYSSWNLAYYVRQWLEDKQALLKKATEDAQ